MFFQVFQGFSFHGAFELKWYDFNINRVGIQCQIPSLKSRTDTLKSSFFAKKSEFLTIGLKVFFSVFQWERFRKLLLKYPQASWSALSPSLHIQNGIPSMIPCFTLVKPWDLAGPEALEGSGIVVRSEEPSLVKASRVLGVAPHES